MTYEDVPPKLLLMHVLHGRPPFSSGFVLITNRREEGMNL
jgi:hypothetical protein